MARFINAQRRVVLVFATVIFTFLIRLISLSAGHNQREGRNSFFVSDKGPFKQASLMFHAPKGTSAYLLRIANFFPFVMVENRGPQANLKAIMTRGGAHPALGQSCGGGDCDCDCDCGSGGCDGCFGGFE
jgi:hypothetical protein